MVGTSSMFGQTSTDSIAVIVNSSIDHPDLSKEQLLNIYTLRARNWKNGVRVVVSDYKGNPILREQFYNYLGTNIKTIKKIWLKAQFTGRITPPQTVDSIQEMIELVVNHPGTIGYVPLSQVPESVNVLIILSHE